MKRRIKEESVLFMSVFKWLVLATVIGIIVGFSTALFLKMLNWSTAYAGRFSWYFLLLPFALLASSLMVKYLAPDAEGQGTEKVIEAVHRRSGKIKAIVVPVKLAATIVTLAFGGSAGKEGPCAQIGGGLASVFADIFKFADIDRKKLVICGISGGFASVFGTPIAGAIFGIEVLFVGSIRYDVLLPSFVAGVISYQVSSWLGITYFYHPVNFIPVFSEAFFLKVVAAGVFFGLASVLLIEALKAGKTAAGKIKLSMALKSLTGGAALVIIALVFSTEYLGLGIEVMESALEGGSVPWYAFILKTITTSITLGFGGSGGIQTPIFFIGSTLGSFLSGILKVDAGMLAAIGFVSVLAGAANTPIAASIMAVELFGAQVAPYASIACVISFVITGHRSVYPSQVLSIKKSASIEVEIGKELETARPSYRMRDGSLIRVLKYLRDTAGKPTGDNNKK
jgi:H+/Cl- antiporter ClcA